MKALIIRGFLIAILMFILGIIGIISILVYFSLELPKISSLQDYRPPIASQILSKDGTVLAEIGVEKREIVSFDQVPSIIIDSFLAAEDSGFYEHKGVDYIGIFRAFLVNLKEGRIVQGGSTITQQVAKSLLLSRKKSWSRKVKDFLLAQRIEERFSKKDILFFYLNQVYLGGGYYGVKSAFKGYFGKELSEATIAEAAIVAGLLVAPGKYSPYVNPQKAKMRQDYVLKRLYETGKITIDQFRTAKIEKTKFKTRKKTKFLAGHFTDWIRQRIIKYVGKDRFLTEGFKVHTTLDYELQKVAESAVAKGVRDTDKRHGFKGPLQQLKNDEEIENFYFLERKKVYREKSSYFTIKDDFDYQYEIEYDPKEREHFKNHALEFAKKMKSKAFVPGHHHKDPILQYLEENKNYKAVVIKADDRERLIYVSVMGVMGVIPFNLFSWAHQRNVSKEKSVSYKLIHPSKRFSPGDIIWVKLTKLKTGLLPHVFKTGRAKYARLGKEQQKEIKKQTYLLCALEQDADVEGALLSIHPQTGEIMAMVGGSDFRKSQFNRVIQAKRQPGSAFKPILFAAALEQGFTPASIIIDSPEALIGVDRTLNWKPRNYDGKYKGPITFRNSLEQSRNIPTIKIAHQIGVDNILKFVDRIGFHATLEKDLSISLGSFSVTLMNLVQTYGIFPSGGRRVPVKAVLSIVDRYGNSYFLEDEFQKKKIEEKPEKDLFLGFFDETNEEDNKNEIENPNNDDINPFLLTLDKDQVYDPRLAYIMSNLLKGVVLHGTGRGARRIGTSIGGKTGTTNDYVDAWFLGFSPQAVTGVWVGLDNNKTLGYGETGAKSALPIWKHFVRFYLKKYGESDFPIPPGIINVKIDKKTGRPINNAGNEQVFMETFVQGTEPGIEETKRIFNDAEDFSGDIFIEDDDYYNIR